MQHLRNAFLVLVAFSCFAQVQAQLCEVDYESQASAAVVTSAGTWGGIAFETSVRISLCDEHDEPPMRIFRMKLDGENATEDPSRPGHFLSNSKRIEWRRDFDVNVDPRFNAEAIFLSTALQWGTDDAIEAEICNNVLIGFRHRCEENPIARPLGIAAVSISIIGCVVFLLFAMVRKVLYEATVSSAGRAKERQELPMASHLKDRMVKNVDEVIQEENKRMADDIIDQAADMSNASFGDVLEAANVHAKRRAVKYRGLPDANSGLMEHAHVLDEGGLLYCSWLSKGQFQAANSQFAVIQLLQMNGSKSGAIFLWTRSGRVGTKGVSSMVRCLSISEAVVEFWILLAEKLNGGWQVNRGLSTIPKEFNGQSQIAAAEHKKEEEAAERRRRDQAIIEGTPSPKKVKVVTKDDSTSPPEVTSPVSSASTHTPTDTPRTVLGHMMADPSPPRPWIGFGLLEHHHEERIHLTVDYLYFGAPAREAGIGLDDRILMIGGDEVHSLDEARTAMRKHCVIGSAVTITFVSGLYDDMGVSLSEIDPTVAKPEPQTVSVPVMTTDTRMRNTPFFFDPEGCKREQSTRQFLAVSSPDQQQRRGRGAGGRGVEDDDDNHLEEEEEEYEETDEETVPEEEEQEEE